MKMKEHKQFLVISIILLIGFWLIAPSAGIQINSIGADDVLYRYSKRLYDATIGLLLI